MHRAPEVSRSHAGLPIWFRRLVDTSAYPPIIRTVRAAQSKLNGSSVPSELPRADRTGFPRHQSCPEQTERTFRAVRAAQSRPNGLSAPSELPKVDRRTFTAKKE